MSEPSPTYTVSLNREKVVDRLLCLFSLEQLEQIAKAMEVVIGMTGHGEVIITVDGGYKNPNPRFIKTLISSEFAKPAKKHTPFE
jgi:hypothetical protein